MDNIQNLRTTLLSKSDWEQKRDELADDCAILELMQNHVRNMANQMGTERAHMGFDLRPAIQILTQVSIEDTDIIVKPLLRAYKRAVRRKQTALKNVDAIQSMFKE